MREIRRELTLHRPATYQIRVPGAIDERWSDWYQGMTVSVSGYDEGLPITTIIVTVDQAALQGLLRRLYSLGAPLISVICVDAG